VKLALAIVVAALVGSLITATVLLGRGEGTHSPVQPASAESPAAPAPARLETAESKSGERIASVEPARRVESAPEAVPGETAEEGGWRRKYGLLSDNQLRHAERDLEAQLLDQSKGRFDEADRHGEYAVVGTGNVYTADSWDNTRVARLRVRAAGSEDPRTLLTTLDEGTNSDLYALRRESLWIKKRRNELLDIPPTSILPRYK